MKKSIFLLIIIILLIQLKSQSQNNINSYTLTLQNDGRGSTPMSVAFNPIKNLYYQATGGGTGSLFFTFDNTGNQVDARGVNFDHRGLWWNANTNKLEGNGFDNSGIGIYPLDNSTGYPNGDVGNKLNFITPTNSQSQGEYNPNSNEMLFWDGTNLLKYNRTTGNSNGTISINIPGSSSFSVYSIGYTGNLGQELAFYDFVNLRVYYYSISGGNYVKYDQLPNDAPNNASWGVSFANGYIFLYDFSTNRSLGYKLNPVNISISAPLATLTSCLGSSSESKTFGVTGSNLTTSVTITVPTYFEISTTSGGTYTSSLTLTNTTNVSETIYVRLSHLAPVASTITGTINATSSGTTASTTVSGTILANPTLSTYAIIICKEATYLITKTTDMSLNGSWAVSGTITVNNGYVTAGTNAGNYVVSYTDGCATVSATVAVGDSDISPAITGEASYKINNTNPIPQGPTASLYVGYNGYNYFSATKPTNTGFYKANNQSGNNAGCPYPFYIFRCTTCPDPDVLMR